MIFMIFMVQFTNSSWFFQVLFGNKMYKHISRQLCHWCEPKSHHFSERSSVLDDVLGLFYVACQGIINKRALIILKTKHGGLIPPVCPWQVSRRPTACAPPTTYSPSFMYWIPIKLIRYQGWKINWKTACCWLKIHIPFTFFIVCSKRM